MYNVSAITLFTTASLKHTKYRMYQKKTLMLTYFTPIECKLHITHKRLLREKCEAVLNKTGQKAYDNMGMEKRTLSRSGSERT
jgi:hypothetical protein